MRLVLLLQDSCRCRILRAGGNAADAAVAVAAALNVTEPCSTGIGGDCFCLYYNASDNTVKALNGSGRSPGALTVEKLRAEGITGDKLPSYAAHCVTVPGAAAGWADTLERFGTMKLSDVLQPAITLAEEGFPVHPVVAHHWGKGAHLLQAESNEHGGDMLMPDGQAPKAGEIMHMPKLAKTFKELAEHGKAGFYEGRIAAAIVETVQKHGGSLTLEDLKAHKSTFEDPITVNYKGVDVWECPPNGQGITALLALNILNDIDVKELGHNTAKYLHVLIESLRLAFADAAWYVADPAVQDLPIDELLSTAYANERRKLILEGQANEDLKRGYVLCPRVG